MNKIVGNFDNTKIKISIKPGTSNNTIVFEAPPRSKNLKILIDGDDIYIKLGKNISLNGVIRICDKCKLIIGNNLTCNNPCYLYIGEETEVTIGDDCMFSSNVLIRTEDSHAIYDVESTKRLNPSSSVHIGNHILIFADAKIFKGVRIDDGSIIGSGTILSNTHISNNALVAGNPYRYIKINVAWEKTYVNSSQFKSTLATEFKKKNVAYWRKTKIIDDLLTRINPKLLKQNLFA